MLVQSPVTRTNKKASALCAEAFSVFCGADPEKAFEGLAEEMRVGVSAHNAYLLYGEVGRAEKLLGG